MDRRQFLVRSPAVVAGGVAHALSGAAPASPPLIDPALERALLEKAGRHYLAIIEISGRWWRHGEVEAEAKSLFEALAEVWCRRRALHEPPAQRPWSHIASMRPDDVTGVPWRALHTAICRLHEDANQLQRWDKVAKRKGESVSLDSIHRAQQAVAKVQALAGNCIEAMHRGSNAANPGLPA